MELLIFKIINIGHSEFIRFPKNSWKIFMHFKSLSSSFLYFISSSLNSIRLTHSYNPTYYWNKELRMASCMTLPKLRTWDGQTTTWKQDYSIEYNSTARALQASETGWVNTSNSTEGGYVDVQEGWTVGHTTEDDYASRASDSCGNFSTFNKKQYHR